MGKQTHLGEYCVVGLSISGNSAEITLSDFTDGLNLALK